VSQATCRNSTSVSTRASDVNGVALVSAGLIVGVPAALWMKSYTANVLAAIASTQAETPTAPRVNPLVAVTIAVAVIVGLAPLASYMPARSAISVPTVALRAE